MSSVGVVETHLYENVTVTLFVNVDFIFLGIDQHCMHTCFASSLRNTNGEFHLTLISPTYAIDAGNVASLYSST